MTSSTSCPSPPTPPALRPCLPRRRWAARARESGEAVFPGLTLRRQWWTFSSSSLLGWESWSLWSGAEGAEGELAGHPACGRVGGLLQDPRPGDMCSEHPHPCLNHTEGKNSEQKTTEAKLGWGLALCGAGVFSVAHTWARSTSIAQKSGIICPFPLVCCL